MSLFYESTLWFANKKKKSNQSIDLNNKKFSGLAGVNISEMKKLKTYSLDLTGTKVD